MNKIQNGLVRLRLIFASRLSRRVVVVVACLLALLVVVQLAWPHDRMRPFLKVSNITVGANTVSEMEKKLTTLKDSSTLELHLGDKVYTEKLINIGVDIDAPKTVQQAVQYPLWQRIIPFTLLGNTAHHPAVITTIDTQNIAQRAKDWSTDAYITPTNATIAVNDTKVVIVADKNGTQYTQEAIQKELQKLVLKKGKQTIKLKGSSVTAERDEKSVSAVAKQAQTAIDTPLTLHILDQSVTVPKTAISSWITFAESNDKKVLTLALKNDLVQTYLSPYEKQIYIAPGTSTVTIVDGKETARSEGSKGRGLNIEKTVAAIKDELIKPSKQTVPLEVSELSPKIIYNRSYSKTSAGLNALLADIGREKGNYAITVRELSGLGRYGSYNGGKVYHPASTYKLFIAYGVLKRIDAGSLHWPDSFSGGKSVEQCFNAMIIQSDNACAEAFGDTLGWAAINDEVKAIGITSSVILRGKLASTTDDQVQLLSKFLYGNIVSADSLSRLLSVMRQQVYRSGIPAGVGVPVADKVGFLNGLLHDSAIVYSSHGTYLISIYTSGSSWANIADAARRIEAYLKS